MVVKNQDLILRLEWQGSIYFIDETFTPSSAYSLVFAYRVLLCRDFLFQHRTIQRRNFPLVFRAFQFLCGVSQGVRLGFG